MLSEQGGERERERERESLLRSIGVKLWQGEKGEEAKHGEDEREGDEGR